jgi:glycosyltransferase involved in cell wall biosynthesis
MPKVILISQFPLPYHHIGSWPNMYNKYLESNHQIDYIVCEEPKTLFPNVQYSFAKNDFITKIRRKLLKYYRIGYIDALFKIIDKSDEKFIIHLIDNYKIVFKINKILIKKGIRNRVYFHAFYHGFSPFLAANNTRNFYEIIDELTFLTTISYKEHINYYDVFPCKVSILHNGVDTKKFVKIDFQEKEKLKLIAGHQNKQVFVWCSRDEPKKGLKLILDVWQKVYENNKGIHLIVIGNKQNYNIDGVSFLGKIPNDELPKHYQMADCYLFPTLCHEGFGLSLAEALNCGCYCIASKIGGVTEVLQFGKFGKLIENPNIISEWETAINNYISGVDKPIIIEKEIYTIQDWIKNMNHLIEESRESLSR